MTQRQVNQWVARLRERAGTGNLGRDRVLSACHARMREMRGLPPIQSQHDEFRLNGEVDSAARSFLLEDDALGRIYQALNARALKSSYRATARERRKFAQDEIATVTQLFTPRWVVEFLLHNTLGRLWRAWHPDSSIAFRWLIDSSDAQPEAFRRASTIRVLDPACGTMNFGLVAAEMLAEMYREEIDRAGRAGWPAEPSVRRKDEISRAILSSNLLGADIDPIALQLARASLAMKFAISGEASPRLFCGDSLFESFVADADVVVTNPPYLSARNLDPARVARLKKRFPCAWRDEYACFIERCFELARAGGRVGMLTMHSFMFTAGYEGLRRKLAQSATIETIAHFGGSLFDVGNPGTLQTVAFTAQKGVSESTACSAIRLLEGDAQKKREMLVEAVRDMSKRFELSQSELHALPRGTWAYWTPRAIREAWRSMRTLGEIAPPRQGLATTDNARFVRYWWEVTGRSDSNGGTGIPACDGARYSSTRSLENSAAEYRDRSPTGMSVPPEEQECLHDQLKPGEKWRPYAKGGQSRRWYQNPLHCVDWAEDGAAIKRSIVERYPYLNGKWEWVAKNSDFYGREGITYSYLTSGRFSARWMPAGSFFDVAGSALFPDDPLTILGILNSSAARQLLHAINPTVNFQVGDLAQLPIPNEGDERLRGCVQCAMAIQRRLDQFDETSRDFVSPMPWKSAELLHRSLHESLHQLEVEIDQIVSLWYGVKPDEDEGVVAFDRADLARRWISFAVRQVLRESIMAEVNSAAINRIREILAEECDEIETQIGGLGEFLTRHFAAWHNQLYRRRPTILSLRAKGALHLVSHRATADVISRIVDVPGNWDRFIDDGIAVNFAPLHEFMADAQQRRYLRAINDDLVAGKYAWSETAKRLDCNSF